MNRFVLYLLAFLTVNLVGCAEQGYLTRNSIKGGEMNGFSEHSDHIPESYMYKKFKNLEHFELVEDYLEKLKEGLVELQKQYRVDKRAHTGANAK